MDGQFTDGGDSAAMREEKMLELFFGMFCVVFDWHGAIDGKRIKESLRQDMLASSDSGQLKLGQFWKTSNAGINAVGICIGLDQILLIVVKGAVFLVLVLNLILKLGEVPFE